MIVPFTDIRTVQTLVEGDKLPLKFGAQDVSVHASGAYTGEISAEMLAKLNCAYVVVGHSERREYHGETDKLIGEKAKVVFAAGMTPIVCCGEVLEIRKEGTHVAYVLDQVKECLEGLTPEQVAAMVIAYEPVWAIGTGEVATPEDAQEVCGAIRGYVAETFGVGGRRSRPDPVRRLGEGEQHRRDHGEARRGRCPGRRREPERRRSSRRSSLP